MAGLPAQGTDPPEPGLSHPGCDRRIPGHPERRRTAGRGRVRRRPGPDPDPDPWASRRSPQAHPPGAGSGVSQRLPPMGMEVLTKT